VAQVLWALVELFREELRCLSLQELALAARNRIPEFGFSHM
jgi:hypothetical protein